jgi:hypothetical protein
MMSQSILVQFVRQHTPMIRFVGPRSLLSKEPHPAANPTPSIKKGMSSLTGGSIPKLSLPISLAEMEAIELGGAGYTFNW